MIQIPALNNAVLFHGDYLLALSWDISTSPTVCHVVQVVNVEVLIAMWLQQNLEPPPTILRDTYNNTVQCHVKEDALIS